jgi:hypothetical protein
LSKQKWNPDFAGMTAMNIHIEQGMSNIEVKGGFRSEKGEGKREKNS